MRRINDAVDRRAAEARRAGAGRARDRGCRLRRGAGRPGALPETSATGTGRTPSCTRRDDPALAAADLAVGRAGVVHSPRRPPSPCRWRSCRTPTPPATSAATRSSTRRPARRSWWRTRTSTPTGWSRSPGLLADPARARRHVGRGRATSARPDAADAVADLVLASAHREALPEPGGDRGGRAGARRRDERPPPPFDALAVGSDIQRRIGVKTSRDEPLARFTTMRVGGPADLFAVAHNLFELRGLVRYARARSIPLFLLGRGSDLVIADAGIRGLVVQVRAEAAKVDGERFHADAGVPMARAATESQKAGLGRARVRARDPGHGRRARSGRTRARTTATRPACSRRRRSCSRTARRPRWRWRRARLLLPPQPVQGRGGAGGRRPGEVVLSATFALRSDGPGDDQRTARRDPPLAPGAPAARPAVGGQRVPQPGGDSAGAPDRRARAQGPPHRRRRRVREAR